MILVEKEVLVERRPGVVKPIQERGQRRLMSDIQRDLDRELAAGLRVAKPACSEQKD